LALEVKHFADDFDPRFKIYHELMLKRAREILLVSSLYDAYIMDEDGRLAERIINEYRGLNLTHPPRLTWVSSAEEALAILDKKKFDLVITMPRLADMNAFALGQEIKKRFPDLPVMLLTHSALPPDTYQDQPYMQGIDRVFWWSGNTDILVAQIKSIEDRLNVSHDTQAAAVRVILFVEDSPVYLSSLLPILYKEIVGQTRAVLGEGLNEEHRLLQMRARAKILIAQSYEEAMELYEQFKPYLLGIISDVRFPRNGELDGKAGITLLSKVKSEIWDLPLMLASSEPENREKAAEIPASFVDKNSPTLHAEIHSFFLNHLGFGDFVFRMPDGQEIARAPNARSLEKLLRTIPEESFNYHWNNNDFSRWLFARTEILLASRMRPLTSEDFSGHVESMRQAILLNLRARRKWRQKGVIVDFDASEFDLDTDFLKIGKGSLGGKARGLAFVSTLLQRNPGMHEKFAQVDVLVPQTLVITTEGFDSFIEANDLKAFSKIDAPDEEIADVFLKAEFPQRIVKDLRAYLSQVHYPLAVRSSGLLEDAQFRAYAGLYRTYMLPNDHPDLQMRLDQLITAIKLVYASTYFRGPKAFARRVGQRTEEEKMAVIVQQLIGEEYGGYYYPAISGVAQSHNYYPFSRMKSEDGIATIALGLGKTVVEGGKALRFSPKHPQLLPQFSTLEDILENAQRSFYTLKMGNRWHELGLNEDSTLEKREVDDAGEEPPVQLLASTYVPAEHRIRDTTHMPGHRIVTFSKVLKYKQFPLADILADVLTLGHEGMGCPVEMEFSVHLSSKKDSKPQFAFLQLRPMTARAELMEVDISDEEIARAFCLSSNALGNANREDMVDILYVKPDVFDPARTIEIGREIGELNTHLLREGRQYLLIGPGRWGSADRWLGIPVAWADISGVGAMVETSAPELKAEPSQGSHFFHNVTTLGINYVTVTDTGEDFLDWTWLTSLPVFNETPSVAHVMLPKPFTLKVDGRKSRGVMFI
jgi:CheY-like chemotaxis protein